MSYNTCTDNTRLQNMYKARGVRVGATVVLSQMKEKTNKQRKDSRFEMTSKNRNMTNNNLATITPHEYRKKINGNVKQLEHVQNFSHDFPTKSDKRREMLKKWQQEKKQQRQQEKANTKPVFKVHHVGTTSNFDLTKIYQEIKGKQISKNKADEQFNLVTESTYEFKPPKNIKPVTMETKKGKSKLPIIKSSVITISMETKKGKLKLPITKSSIITRSKKPLTPDNTKSKINSGHCAGTRIKKTVSVPNSAVASTAGSSGNQKRRSTHFSQVLAVDSGISDLQIKHVAPDKTEAEMAVVLSSGDDEVFLPVTNGSRKRSTKSRKLQRTMNSSVLTDDPVTPVNKSTSSGVTYVSPFVTMSRGKDNARLEYHRRSIRGGSENVDSPLVKKDITKSTSPKAAATYFTQLLNNQTLRLQMLCQEWKTYKLEQKPPEEVCDMINVPIGQTELLLQKKFRQFQNLINCCESGNSETPVTCLDLHGFWDTVMIQINNLDQRFDNLERLEKNNWEEILPSPKPKKQRGRPRKQTTKKSTSSTSSLRAVIQEARKRKALEQESAIEVASALNSARSSTPAKTPNSKRTSLRIAVLNSETKRKISSPGLTMMKITQAAKSAEKFNEAPRSILKAERRRSLARKSKAVLFKDDCNVNENKENEYNPINLIDFNSPTDNKIEDKIQRRRSSRLEKRQSHL